MNEWEKRAAEIKGYLKQLEDWLKTISFRDLPEGVKRIIVRGESSFKEQIKKYEEWAKEYEKFEKEEDE